MQNITITEIRKHLEAKGATLTKLKMRINGNDAYEVSKGEAFNVYTVHGLKEAYRIGAI